jgi:putative PIN family toxin of toxin-antitoxin system
VRLVLDTNVVVSALVWGGVPYKLIEAAAAGDVELVTSPALLAELREVLGRAHLASRLAAQRSGVEQAIALYGELAIGVVPLATPRVVPGDVDDDQLIAAAVTGSADLVVSGDRHLLGLGSHRGIDIVNAAVAVRRVENARTRS